MHVLCFPFIASVVLVLGSPASTPADGTARTDGTTPEPADIPADAVAPLRIPSPPPPPGSAWLPVSGVAPLSDGAQARRPAPASPSPDGGAPVRAPGSARPPSPATSWLPGFGVAPLDAPEDPFRRDGGADPRASVAPPTVVAPLGPGPSLTPGRPDPRTLRAVRIELLVGPIWRIRTAETLVLASVEVGRLQGFSGTFHVGMVVAPDRDFVAANDFPIGGGVVARRRLGARSLDGSIGLTAGILVHRAATDLGVVHRVDPDFQLPVRFAWTAGRVGLSVALLQGFSVRTRTYERRGVEVWKRIPYRIGFAIGLHFDIGVGPAKSRRAARRPGEVP